MTRLTRAALRDARTDGAPTTPIPAAWLAAAGADARLSRRYDDLDGIVVTDVRGAALLPEVLHDVAERLHAAGAERVWTPAVTDLTAIACESVGFTRHERLDVLAHDLDTLPECRGPRLRTGRARDTHHVLSVDAAAFGAAWRLDAATFTDTLEATRTHRFRVCGRPARAYAIAGCWARVGYLHRLAVHPADQRRGVGAALVIDALRWSRRWRAEQMLVNTQASNEAARRLYERLGFRDTAEPLWVLCR